MLNYICKHCVALGENQRLKGKYYKGVIFVALRRFITRFCACVWAKAVCVPACMRKLHTLLVLMRMLPETIKWKQLRLEAGQPAAVHFSPPYVFVRNICCAPNEGWNQSKCYFPSCSFLKAAKLYWYLPDQPTLSNVTTGHQWHSQTDHLVSSVQ